MARLDGKKRYSGSSSYRAIAREAHILPVQAAHEAYEIWAKGCRVGFSKINADEYYWYVTFNTPDGSFLAEREENPCRDTVPRPLSAVDRFTAKYSDARYLEDRYQ
jgi:hypothetical protein